MDCLRFVTRLCGARTAPEEDNVIEIQTTPHEDLSPPPRHNTLAVPNPVERRCFYLVRTDIKHSEVEIFGIPVEQFALLEPLDLRLEARAVST